MIIMSNMDYKKTQSDVKPYARVSFRRAEEAFKPANEKLVCRTE